MLLPEGLPSYAAVHRFNSALVTAPLACQGSGKTLAFGLPILQCILEERQALGAAGLEQGRKGINQQSDAPPGIRALILTPTRELALQVRVLQVDCHHF